jgi:hypothetical protein
MIAAKLPMYSPGAKCEWNLSGVRASGGRVNPGHLPLAASRNQNRGLADFIREGVFFFDML